MDDLVAFLNARLDEDEAAAAAASDSPWTPWRERPGLGLRQLEYGVMLPGQGSGSLASIATASWTDAEHIARHDPARALREVAAKREIVGRCEQAIRAQGIYMEDGQEDLAVDVLQMLAATWGDHPDYRDGWRP